MGVGAGLYMYDVVYLIQYYLHHHLSNFKMKLREVNFGRFLTIVERFYFSVMYFFVYFISVLAAYQWPSGLFCLF